MRWGIDDIVLTRKFRTWPHVNTQSHPLPPPLLPSAHANAHLGVMAVYAALIRFRANRPAGHDRRNERKVVDRNYVRVAQ